ncbi:uncharacterized protein LOC126667894 [Mercurialis annua]|uniref:uncharacterized protein LOC126667894 n=1 Tax=Mercurialis annua TaxID=3986 RepID=UPI00215E879A|nr:uncharacterized protein LOC126667894 [Mercurialis annua]
MGSNREDPLSYINNSHNPSSNSSPITVSDHLLDPSASASNSFQNDAGFLNESAASSSSDLEFGFSRPEFRQNPLAGTVQFYQRHVFLCYKNPSVWPPRIEAADFDRLPRLLSAAVLARKADMNKETRLTICEGHDGTETSNGDVLIFPDMIRYRRLTHFDVDTFVEEVLVKEGEWLPGTPETLKGSYIFVCSHGSRDRRCGVCGPALVSKFKEEIELHGLQCKVSVSPCSHIGGHKYAGNVMIFGSSINGVVTGHWYGYVTPDEVSILLEQHIAKGEIVDFLWRGQMGLSEEEQIKSQELRLQLNGGTDVGENTEELSGTQVAGARSEAEVTGCCQQNGKSCCQNPVSNHKDEILEAEEKDVTVFPDKKKSSERILSRVNSVKGMFRVCAMPTWFDSWEREDTYAGLTVVCAAVSVAAAYHIYKQSR